MSAGYMRRCAGKDRFNDKASAQDARVSLAAAVGKPMDAYQCDQCLGWHVGGAGKRFMTRYRRRGKRPNKRMRGRV